MQCDDNWHTQLYLYTSDCVLIRSLLLLSMYSLRAHLVFDD
jgi:hypothetical protein